VPAKAARVAAVTRGASSMGFAWVARRGFSAAADGKAPAVARHGGRRSLSRRDRVVQGGKVHRLDEVFVEAGSARAFTVLGAAIAAHRDQTHRAD
jgi:hypothetical protein